MVYRGLNVFFKRAKNKGRQVLLLHGFGGSSKTVDCLFYFLKNRGYDVSSLDFPGFGESDEPKEKWTIRDYAGFVEWVIGEQELDRPVVIGHSFGGRVGIILAALGKCGALVLIDSAGMRPRRGLSYYFNVTRYKIRKALGGDVSAFGSSDYRSLSPVMKQTFVSVVNDHLDNLLKEITVPTLILWGDRDRETPPYMAKRIRKRVKNSRLVMLDGGHYSYIDAFLPCCNETEKFICSL